MYDYESLLEDKYFNELVCNYYINRVVRQSLTNNIENAIKEYVTKHAAKIELGFKNLNGTTFFARYDFTQRCNIKSDLHCSTRR